MKTTTSSTSLLSKNGPAGALLALALVLLVPLLHFQADAASPADRLEEGIFAEETQGDIPAAIRSYQQIVEDSAASRPLVAQAQLRLGLCQLKLGNKPQAVSALERLTREFPDRDKLLEIVGQQMPQVLEELLQQVERNYIHEVDRGELMETAIRAIVGKLDAKGGFLGTNELEFLGAREVKQFTEQIDQRVAGVGLMLKAEGNEVLVQSPLAGSPALAGGVRAGDRLVSINGEPLPERGLETAVRELRGTIGTPVTIGVIHRGSEEVVEIKLVRDTIKLPSVSGYKRRADASWDFMLDDTKKIGYVRLSGLGQESAGEMKAALDNLAGRNFKSLVLDLRSAPGGLLDTAVAISDLFVNDGLILTVKGRSGDQDFEATPGSLNTNLPIVVLVDRKTMSAAEIIAACLQDHHRALVVGERTAGHGIVRSLFRLKSGIGAVKLPVAAFYRPNGQAMNRYPEAKDSDEWGVTPDPGWVIAMSEVEMEQFQTDRAARGTVNDGRLSKSTFVDRPLEKALEALQHQAAGRKP